MTEQAASGSPDTSKPTPPTRPRRPGTTAARPTRGPVPSKPLPPTVQRPTRTPIPSFQRLIETAGPDPATPLDQVRLAVGTIVGPFGVNGEVKLRLSTDDPEHLASLRRIYLGAEPQPRVLLGMRMHKGMGLLRIGGVTSPEQAEALRGQTVRIAGTDARPLEPGDFYLYQLVGLEAFDEAGERVGTLADIMETGAHDVFVISRAGAPDMLLPNHPEFVLEINPKAGKIIIRPIVFNN